MLSLKSRCIDEQVLSIISGQNAHDSITSRLGFLAGNTDLFPDQRVDQRALADVRTADHCNITAAEVFRFFSLFIFTHKLSLSNF